VSCGARHAQSPDPRGPPRTRASLVWSSAAPELPARASASAASGLRPSARSESAISARPPPAHRRLRWEGQRLAPIALRLRRVIFVQPHAAELDPQERMSGSMRSGSLERRGRLT